MGKALEITTKIGCNNNCKCCPQNNLLKNYKASNKLMSLYSFSKILSTVPKDVDILFSGFCEVFLNKQSSDMMVYAYKNGYNISLYTTLVNMDLYDIARLQEIKSFLNITIHAPDDINFKYPYDEWRMLYYYFKKLNIPHNVVTLGPSPIKNAIRFSTHNRAGNLSPSQFYLAGRVGCRVSDGQLMQNNIVLPNGDVYICCMSYSLKHYLGNLLKESWNEIHSGQNYKKLIQLMNEEDSDLLCRTCHEAILIGNK